MTNLNPEPISLAPAPVPRPTIHDVLLIGLVVITALAISFAAWAAYRADRVDHCVAGAMQTTITGLKVRDAEQIQLFALTKTAAINRKVAVDALFDRAHETQAELDTDQTNYDAAVSKYIADLDSYAAAAAKAPLPDVSCLADSGSKQ